MDRSLIVQLPYLLVGYLVIVSVISFLRNKAGEQIYPGGTLKVCVLIALTSAVILPLKYRLLSAESPILSWECDTVLAHYEAYQRGLNTAEFTAESLKTNQGLLSTSATSLLYGVPTYGILDLIGWSRFSLRLLPYVWGLMSLALGFYVLRRLANLNTALFFIVIVATNPMMLYYMGYGVSQTATLAAVLFSTAGIIKALRDDSIGRYFWGSLAAIALITSLYNYAPGRLLVISLLGFLGLYGLSVVKDSESTGHSRQMAFAIILLASFIFIAQTRLNTLSSLISVRGEQAFLMAEQEKQVRRYLGSGESDSLVSTKISSLGMKAKFFYAIAAERVNEFVNRYRPNVVSWINYESGSSRGELLPPLHGAIVVPILIGMVYSIRRCRSFFSSLLIIFFLGSTIPLLFTNRVDNHRSFQLILPLSAWAAWGFYMLFKNLEKSRVGRITGYVVAPTLTISMVIGSWSLLGAEESYDSNTKRIVSQLSPLLDAGTSVITSGLNCQTEASVLLMVADSARRTGEARQSLLSPAIGRRLSNQNIKVNASDLAIITQSVSKRPVVIISAHRPSQLTDVLKASGLSVIETSNGSTIATVVTSN